MYVTLLFWLLLLGVPLSADGGRAPGQQSAVPPDPLAGLSGTGRAIDTRHLTLTPTVTRDAAPPGGRLTLVLDVVPKPGMHVYAPEQKDLIPVSLLLKADERIRAGARRLPPSEAYFFAPLGETQRVYSRPFRIEQEVRIADTPETRRRAASGEDLTISATLRYQACDNAVCYLPQEVPVSWTVRIKKD